MNDHHLNSEQLFRELDLIKDGIEGVHHRLDVLNGRTRRLEVKVAIMWALWGSIGAVLVALIHHVV